MFGFYSHWKVWYKSEKAFGMCSEWHYTTRGLAYGDMTTRPDGLVVMSPSANLPRCVMPFWTHAHAFSLYDYMWVSFYHDTYIVGDAFGDKYLFIILCCLNIWLKSAQPLGFKHLVYYTANLSRHVGDPHWMAMESWDNIITEYPIWYRLRLIPHQISDSLCLVLFGINQCYS